MVGGHDLLGELTDAVGKYVLLELVIHDDGVREAAIQRERCELVPQILIAARSARSVGSEGS